MTTCTQHLNRTAAFECRACGKPFCQDCRDPDEAGICTKCGISATMVEAAEDKVHVTRTDLGARKKRGARAVMAALVLLNVAAGAWLAMSGPSVAPTVEESFDDLDRVSRAVEHHRGPDGRVPEDLEDLLGELPPRQAAKIRRGEIRYYPSPDGTDFVLEASLDGTVLPEDDPHLDEQPDSE